MDHVCLLVDMWYLNLWSPFFVFKHEAYISFFLANYKNACNVNVNIVKKCDVAFLHYVSRVDDQWLVRYDQRV